MQFRLRTLLLFFVVIWSSMAAFGPWGILVTIVSVAVVTALRVFLARGGRWIEIVAAILITLILIGLLDPGVSVVREAARRGCCANNLKQIVLALLNYHDAYGRFPPAYVADANGKPMHSWRVLILPYLERKPLYDAYDFDEPWDGPNNSKLAASVLKEYGCLSAPHYGPTTNYVAVIGPGTAWPGDKTTSIADFRDGTSNTILVVETSQSDIHWMEPRDLSLDDVLSTDPHSWQKAISHGRTEGYFVVREWNGRNVAMADGAVLYLNDPWPPNLQDLFTIADGAEPGEIDLTNYRWQPVTTVHWAHCVGLTIFIISLILLLARPLPKEWIKPAVKEDGKRQDDRESR
jgi:hypothetical protein